MHIIAAKAVAFYEARQPEFVEYQRATLDNALVLANELKRLGLHLMSGGTDTHLMLISLAEMENTGRDVEEALERAGIVANRDGIPFDKRSSLATSGIRLGTPAVTTRGFGKEEMKQIASLIVRVINNMGNSDIENQVNQEVRQMCQRFPVPGIND